MKIALPVYLEEKRQLIDSTLNKIIHDLYCDDSELGRSVSYSILSGGKRLRPILCIASCESLGADSSDLLPIACAIEMIHTYSLIHDDLPSMDDDNVRRGKPTNHMIFGEATAILTGDALLTDAFNVVSNSVLNGDLPSSIGLEIIRDLSYGAGSSGMVKGQSVDLLIEGNENIDIDIVEDMHLHKTGALIRCSVTTGARFAGAEDDLLESFGKIGNYVGLAYQINDDILDIEGGDDFGKNIGADIKKSKVTYPSVAGLEAAKRRVVELTESALLEIKKFGDNPSALSEIVKYLGERKN